MKPEVIVASQNEHKIQELNEMLGQFINLKPLPEDWANISIPEDKDTFEGNSAAKALFVYERLGGNTLADDSGLEVFTLNGAPGVYSARYAGTGKDADNVEKLLNALEYAQDRTARFRCVISYLSNGRLTQFEGTVDGHIARKPAGNMGFGYDPIFIPDGFDKTFAQMRPEEKNLLSHRAAAVKALKDFLSSTEV